MLWDRLRTRTKTTRNALQKGDLKFTLEGDKLKGSWVLVRMRGDKFGGKRTNWLLIKHRDADSDDDGDTVLEEDRSVALGRTMQQIAEGKGRRPKPFMLATTTPGKADAVWNSNRAEAGGDEFARRPYPATQGHRCQKRQGRQRRGCGQIGPRRTGHGESSPQVH